MAIRPCGHRVLVLPDVVAERRGSLFVPETALEREQQAQIFGTLVSVGQNAWKAYDDGQPWAKVGDRVAIAKFAGFRIVDESDGKEYRLLNDEDICAVLTPGVRGEIDYSLVGA